MLTDAEVKHVAKLARIQLTDADVEKFKKDLSSVLGYIDALKKADTEAIEPLSQVTGLENGIRPDENRPSFSMNEKLNTLLVGQAPMKEERFVKVKSVLKK